MSYFSSTSILTNTSFFKASVQSLKDFNSEVQFFNILNFACFFLYCMIPLFFFHLILLVGG